MKGEKGQYFSEKVVFEMLGGLDEEFSVKRKKYYRLKNGDLVVIRKNTQSLNYYWYNVNRDLFDSSIKYVVCVAGYEGIYKIPISVISELAAKGQISAEKDGNNYKVVFNRISDELRLHLIRSEKSIDIKQFQVYRQYYDKTNEIGPEQTPLLIEGAKRTVTVNAYERNTTARTKCLEHYGAKCQVCGFDFAETYGPDFEGLMEVHHIVPISSIRSEYTVDPIKDLIPLCSNCHTAIHKLINNRCLSVEELRKRIASNRKTK